MNQELENLVVLQAQDLELARLRAELAEAPQRVRAVEGALADSDAARTRFQEQVAAEEKLRRGQELEIAGHRSKLDRLQRSLDGATSAQQVAAFEHEIGFSREAVAKLEEEEFASLERTESLEAELSDATILADRRRRDLEQERQSAAALAKGHQETIAGIERERSALRQSVSAARLATYDKLTKTRGTAVAEALGSTTAGKCAACQMSVRPQRWQDLTGREHENEIFACETCGRLLFWDPRRDTPKPWAAGERLHAAQGASAAATGRGTR